MYSVSIGTEVVEVADSIRDGEDGVTDGEGVEDGETTDEVVPDSIREGVEDGETTGEEVDDGVTTGEEEFEDGVTTGEVVPD